VWLTHVWPTMPLRRARRHRPGARERGRRRQRSGGHAQEPGGQSRHPARRAAHARRRHHSSRPGLEPDTFSVTLKRDYLKVPSVSIVRLADPDAAGHAGCPRELEECPRGVGYAARDSVPGTGAEPLPRGGAAGWLLAARIGRNLALRVAEVRWGPMRATSSSYGTIRTSAPPRTTSAACRSF